MVFTVQSEAEGVDSRYLNRELSWLDFNARVLALAENDTVPLLERMKFCAIYTDNLDEFFRVRVAGLKDQVAAGIIERTPDGRTPAEQLLEISDQVRRLGTRLEAVFHDHLVPAMAEAGVRFSTWEELDDDDTKFLEEEFEHRIFPVLTPLAVDPGHPFPYISDLSLNLAVIVREGEHGERRFARVKVPSTVLSRFVVMPDGERVVPLEQVIAAHLPQLFPGMVVEAHHPFRVTRNADLTVEDEEAEDLLSAVETELRRRRFGYAVRLEVENGISSEVLELLQRELDLADDDVYAAEGPLGLDGLWALMDLDRPDLKYPPWQGVPEPQFSSTIDDEKVDVFARIRERDILLHHPYTSFTSSVEEFIRQAVADRHVQAIKLTLYRTSGDSPIVHALTRAAESGKQVAALVELKARFDEAANIEWAKRLEDAGVHVAYGVLGLKTHTKTTLVVREEEGRLHRYCHVGTGNYNPTTARIYEDVGLLTDDPDLADDLTLLFNYLTGYARDVEYRKLLVAPDALRDRMENLIRQEIDVPRGTGRIVMKMNALVDDRMIDLLYEASGAGVEVDLIIRGICCLRAGVPGLSDNIRVRSVVGRYLEHSRIYYFANGDGPSRPVHFIGSADVMPRNLDRRVEAMAMVEAPDLRARLDEIIEVELEDDVLAWTLDDSTWRPPMPGGTVETHRVLEELALKRVGRDG